MANDDQLDGPNFTAEEQAELDRLIAEGEALEQEHDIHPIVRHITHLCLEDDGETWRKELPQDRLDEVNAYLDQVRDTDKPQLGKAVYDLLRLSIFLDHEKKVGMPAYQLFSLGNDAVVRFGLIQSVDTTTSDDTEQRAKAVTGAEEKSTAPGVDDEKPEGAVSLDTVTPWRRI